MQPRPKKLRQEVRHWKAEHSGNSERNKGRSLLTSKEVCGLKEPATEIFSPAYWRNKPQTKSLYKTIEKAMTYILRSSQCSNKEQAEIGTSDFLRRAPALLKGGFLLLVRQGPDISFYGGSLEGSLTAGRYLRSGCSKPDSDPRPSIGTESGIRRLNIGAYTMARNTLIRTLGYIPSIPQLFTADILRHSSIRSIVF
ncbi:hypothetical protein [Turicimonas muris]|uniref:hypothetical protein n=1 Tax=Turicimonas muris TaxID=1796652 RepID=UPI00248B0093|nr:hypothetical protein [Turicimonas muris]